MVLDLLALAGGEGLGGGHDLTLVVSRGRGVDRGSVGLTVQEAQQVAFVATAEIEIEDRLPVTALVRADGGDIEIVDPTRIGRPTELGENGAFSARDHNGGE
jgi:hypothetical protein